MKVLVFGAAGFVGRNLVEKLAREDKHELVGSDVVEDPFDNSVKYLKVNVLDRDHVFEAVRGSEVVVHLAASPLVASLEDPTNNMKVNVEGTLNILDAARKHGVKKVVYSSASSVVGTPKYNPVDEEHPCNPKTAYAVAKKTCEDYLRVYNEMYGLHYLVFRFFNVYGPRQGQKSGALIPNLYRNLIENKEFQVYGDGTNTRDFIYVEDVADFCCSAVKDPVENMIVNMGTGHGTTIIRLISLGSKILDVKPKIAFKPPRPGEIGNFVADARKLFRVFGNRSFTTLEEGLETTFSWLREHPSWGPK